MASESQAIVLDSTLQELYAMGEESNEHKIVIINGVPTAKVQMTASLPLSKKFVYQSPFAEKESGDTLARIFLQVVGQGFGFIAGNMPLILFDINDVGSSRDCRADTIETFSQITPSQRPQWTYVEKPEDIVLSPGATIAVSSPMDCLLHLSHSVDPEVHYSLLSKRDLAFSGLPTPETHIIDTDFDPSQVSNETLVAKEVSRMMQPIVERVPPFIIKMPQAVSGHGTLVIRTEAEKQEVVKMMPREIESLFQQLHPTNMHLRPSCIILQTMVPGESHSISMFITKSGEAVVTACCKQVVEPSGAWSGAFIAYREQDELKRRFEPLVKELAEFFHKKGFYGPVGVDVMTDPEGRHLLIDMNMRVTGSHPLGFVKTHFTQRNFYEAAVLFPLFMNCTRDHFQQAFSHEFEVGSLVINGWCHDRDRKISNAALLLAAENMESLRKLIARVKEYYMSPAQISDCS